MSFQQFNITPWLTPVRTVSTANIAGTYYNGQTNNGVGATLTIAAASLTVDSVVMEEGDRLLLSAQTNANENGIYVVLSIGATVILQRAADQQSIEQYHAGQYVTAGAGTLNAGTAYVLVEPLPGILGVDNLVWSSNVTAGAVSFSGGPSVANSLVVFSDVAGNIKPQTVASTLGFGLTISTGNFAVSAGTITASGNITSSAGNIIVTAGSVTASAGITSTAGNITSGSPGNDGTFISFPPAGVNGTLILAAANAGGAFNTTISNDTMGQSSVMTIPDPANALGRFLVGATATPFVSGEFPVASGTGGLMVSSGLAASDIQNSTNIIAATTADIGGGGAGPISVVVAGLTAASIVVATIESSTNAVQVQTVTATATGFDIVFSGDPGAACLVNYVAFIAAQ